jgi:FlgD Ig-like domain/NHL repeat
VRRPILLTLTLALVAASPLGAGTFDRSRIAPALDLEALTRGVAREHLGRELFANPYATVTIENVNVYDVFPYVETRTFQVVSDPRWNRLVHGEVGRSLRAYDGQGRTFGALKNPRGLAVDENDRVFVADAGNNRVLVLDTRTEFGAMDLSPSFEITGLHDPQDLAVSDGGTPFVPGDDILYVAETGGNRVAAYALTTNGARRVATLGELGSGRGRFAGPTAIAVGRSDGANTRDVYIADAHTRRLVHLRHDGGSFTWVDDVQHDADIVTSLDSDQWGNVYAAAPNQGVVRKFAPDLTVVAELRGDVARPRAFHVPFRNVRDHRGAGWMERVGVPSGVSVDQWTDQTGMRLWGLGVEVRNLEVHGDDAPVASFLLTDQADVTLELVDAANGRSLARQGAGSLPAGNHSLAIGNAELAAAAGSKNVTLRVAVASEYDGGPTASAQTALRGGDASVLPSRPMLVGVTPNPVSGSAQIVFALPAGGDREVSLGIYDALGRRVKSLDGTFGAGRHEITWDGRSQKGARMPAGVYFLRLNTDAARLMQRLVVVH